MEYRREIAVVYKLEDALQKINVMRQHGFSEHEIHVFTKDIHPLKSLKMYTDIHVHQAGGLFDKIQSKLFNKPLYEVCLRPLGFSDDEMHHYGQLIEKDAIFIVAQHNEPLEKEPSRGFAGSANVQNR